MRSMMVKVGIFLFVCTGCGAPPRVLVVDRDCRTAPGGQLVARRGRPPVRRGTAAWRPVAQPKLAAQRTDPGRRPITQPQLAPDQREIAATIRTAERLRVLAQRGAGEDPQIPLAEGTVVLKAQQAPKDVAARRRSLQNWCQKALGWAGKVQALGLNTPNKEKGVLFECHRQFGNHPGFAAYTP